MKNRTYTFCTKFICRSLSQNTWCKSNTKDWWVNGI